MNLLDEIKMKRNDDLEKRKIMKIIKKINNNVVWAIDGNGEQLVVFGRGLGFRRTPYELEDLSLIERTFYDVNSHYISTLGDYPSEIISVAAKINEMALMELECELNTNLTFTLADHLNFAVERIQKGIDVSLPIEFDIGQLYPKEFDLGKRALDLLKKRINLNIPNREAASIAMHLINAEVENDDLHSTLMMMKITTDIIKIVENVLEVHFNQESFSLNRFVMHLRYLVQRMTQGKASNHGVSLLMPEMKKVYPKVFESAQAIGSYLKDEWGWECNEEELVYLMIHINRIWIESQNLEK